MHISYTEWILIPTLSFSNNENYIIDQKSLSMYKSKWFIHKDERHVYANYVRLIKE